jgi:hypothetical protein
MIDRKRHLGLMAALILSAACNRDAPPTEPNAPATAAAGPNFPPARALVPFVRDAGTDCIWTMHDKSEKWIRGSIGRGDEDPVFDFVDPAFAGWSDSDRHPIEVSAGDPARRLPASAWAAGAESTTPGSIGFYANAQLRKLIGGASSIQIWKGGKPIFNAALANTPSAAELDACVVPPGQAAHSDEE